MWERNIYQQNPLMDTPFFVTSICATCCFKLSLSRIRVGRCNLQTPLIGAMIPKYPRLLAYNTKARLNIVLVCLKASFFRVEVKGAILNKRLLHEAHGDIYVPCSRHALIEVILTSFTTFIMVYQQTYAKGDLPIPLKKMFDSLAWCSELFSYAHCSI